VANEVLRIASLHDDAIMLMQFSLTYPPTVPKSRNAFELHRRSPEHTG
jgi:hypothetical protein